MKINSSVKPPTISTGQVATPKATGTPVSAATEPSSGAQVQLSAQATALLGAEAVIKDSPVLDAKRVAEIKQAISEGKFSVNPEKIADGLLDNVRQMLKGRQSH